LVIAIRATSILKEMSAKDKFLNYADCKIYNHTFYVGTAILDK